MKKLTKEFKFNLLENDFEGVTTTFEVELRPHSKGPEFSVCGTVHGARRRYIMGGQCLDTVDPYLVDPIAKRIVELWREYHLNTMQAGTPKQMQALKEKETHSYEESVDYLKEIGLYEDEGIKYGYTWQYKEIPAKILEEIKELLKD